MGLFDGLTNMISSAMSGGGTSQIADDVMGILQQHGINGVSGLVSQFEQTGMGEHVASWVSEGENLPISPDQVQAALGSPAIASIAAKFGIDPAQASAMISQHLPAIVNHLTPDGQVPDDSNQ
jgi:uncharacterized protein YidB (DUF937 family)